MDFPISILLIYWMLVEGPRVTGGNRQLKTVTRLYGDRNFPEFEVQLHKVIGPDCHFWLGQIEHRNVAIVGARERWRGGGAYQ